MNKSNKERKEHFIKIGNELVPVSKEVYMEYYKLENRERYLQKLDNQHGLLQLGNYDEELIIGGETALHSAVDVEKIAITGMMIEELLKCLSELNESEIALLTEIYFEDKPIRQIAREQSVSDTALRKRRDVALKKLRKMIKE